MTELTSGESSEKDRISPRSIYSQLWMQSSVWLCVNSFNGLWFNSPILDLAKTVYPVQICGDSSVALRPEHKTHQWHVETHLCQAVNVIPPVGIVLWWHVPRGAMAEQNRAGICISKPWGALAYDKLWRAHTPRKPTKSNHTWRGTCLWPTDPGTLHFVSYHTRQKQCSPSLLRVHTAIHTPSRSYGILGMVGRTAHSGTWSTMVASNHWSEVERVSPWCPSQPIQFWDCQSPSWP